MNSNSLFVVYLFLSVAIHTGVFAAFSFQPRKEVAKNRPIEVFYQEREVRVEGANFTKIIDKKTTKTPLKDIKSIGDFIKMEIFKERDNLKLEKEVLEDKSTNPSEKSVTLPDIPGQAYKTPEYKNYYSKIREKIRKYAYYNYKKMLEGEVFLTFTLTPDGKIADLLLDRQNSSNQKYLRDISLKSIKRASPFPKFPEKLVKFKKLSFKVIICYELK